MTIPPTRLLHRPFDDTKIAVVITQPFANNNPGLEPEGWKYPDGSIGYHPDPRAQYGAWHNGVDYALNCGTPLLAAADGVVYSAGWDTSGFGNLVVLDHGGGLFTGYAHEQAVEVRPGQAITSRQVIGHVGSTGNSTGCHSHWFVSTVDPVNGFWLYLDPYPFVDFPSVRPPVSEDKERQAITRLRTLANAPVPDGTAKARWSSLYAYVHSIGPEVK